MNFERPVGSCELPAGFICGHVYSEKPEKWVIMRIKGREKV